MKNRFRRVLIIAVALFVLALSVAPVALCATHWRHVCNHTNCPICTAIRDDFSILRIIVAAAIAATAFRIAFARVQAESMRAADGFGIFSPIERKVRLNN